VRENDDWPDNITHKLRAPEEIKNRGKERLDHKGYYGISQFNEDSFFIEFIVVEKQNDSQNKKNVGNNEVCSEMAIDIKIREVIEHLFLFLLRFYHIETADSLCGFYHKKSEIKAYFKFPLSKLFSFPLLIALTASLTVSI
jgi:hypothetical protein